MTDPRGEHAISMPTPRGRPAGWGCSRRLRPTGGGAMARSLHPCKVRAESIRRQSGSGMPRGGADLHAICMPTCWHAPCMRLPRGATLSADNGWHAACRGCKNRARGSFPASCRSAASACAGNLRACCARTSRQLGRGVWAASALVDSNISCTRLRNDKLALETPYPRGVKIKRPRERFAQPGPLGRTCSVYVDLVMFCLVCFLYLYRYLRHPLPM